MTTRKIPLAFAAALLAVVSAASQISNEISLADHACHKKGAKIMILGTFHFANPGLDAVNVKVDDVLGEKRQREIAEVLGRIAAYKPSKIAIEAQYKSTYWQTRYASYLKDDYELGRNEIEQLGFRLAKRLGHLTVYPIDYPMFMSGLVDAEVEVRRPAEQQPTATKSEESVEISEADKRFMATPIIEHLIEANTPESINTSHQQYMTMLMPNFENPAIYERADRVANWYKRNLRMFSNLNRIATFDGSDRILLIVGAGHLKILNDFVIDAPQFCLVDAKKYLKPQ